MAFDQEAFNREMEAQHDQATKRVESEAARDDLSGISPAVVVKIARRVLAELKDYELVDGCADHFEDGLRSVAEVLGVPYIELSIAVHATMHNPETTREDLTTWVAWCQQHAPERLTAQKAGA